MIKAYEACRSGRRDRRWPTGSAYRRKLVLGSLQMDPSCGHPGSGLRPPSDLNLRPLGLDLHGLGCRPTELLGISASRAPEVWPLFGTRTQPDRAGHSRTKRADVTAVTQPAGADQAAVTLGNTDGEIVGLTISDPPTQVEVQALRDKCEELADDVRALSALVHALRGALVAVGILNGLEHP